MRCRSTSYELRKKAHGKSTLFVLTVCSAVVSCNTSRQSQRAKLSNACNGVAVAYHNLTRQGSSLICNFAVADALQGTLALSFDMQAVWVNVRHALQLDVAEDSFSTRHRQGSGHFSTALEDCDLSDRRIICSMKDPLRPLGRDARCSKSHVCLCERKMQQLSSNNFNMKRSLGHQGTLRRNPTYSYLLFTCTLNATCACTH
jgi:hypothetical protein